MRASAPLSILCLATLAAGCGSARIAASKDAAPGADVAGPDASPGTDVADRRDGALPDTPPADGPGLEANADATPPVDGGLAAFCTGDAPRMLANGAALTPTVASYPIVMDCCDGGGLVVTSDALDFPIGVRWLVEGGPSYTLPVTIDLGSPPQGWQTQVIAGCSVTSAGCVGPHDYYRTSLVGWLTVAWDPSQGLDMSICVHVEEDPVEPAYLLHSLDLYLPHA